MDRRGHTCRTIFLLVAVCGGQAAIAGTAEDEFAVAAGHYQARRWDLAAEAFEAFSRQFPQHELAADAQFYQAESLAQVGQFAGAAELLDRLIGDSRAGDNLRRAMFRRGEAAYLARDLPAAKKFLQAFRQTYPDDELLAHLLVYLGDVHTMLRETELAEAAYRACLDRFPSGPLATSCKRGLARSLVVREELAEAEVLLVELAAVEDTAVAQDALVELARLASLRRDYATVQQHCEKLVLRDEQLDPLARLLYAEALHELGDAGEAEKLYVELSGESTDATLRRRAVYGRLRLSVERKDHEALERLGSNFLAEFKDDPLSCHVYAALAESRLSRQKYADASQAFMAATECGAEGEIAARCHAGLAICRAASGDWDGAKQHLGVLADAPQGKWDSASTTYRVAELAYSAGARGVAAELFEQAAETASSPELAANALAGLAWAQLRQEDFLGSAETFEKLVQKYPDDPRAAEAGLLRAQILERRQEYDAALAAYHRVINDLASDDVLVLPKALFLAARLHDRLHQSHEARELYTRLIGECADSPHVPDAHYHLGWLLREAGEKAQAAVQWQSIHELGAETSHWREATYLLAEDAALRGDMDRAGELIHPLIHDTRVADSAPAVTTDPGHDADESEREIVTRSLLLAAQLAMQDDNWQQARGHVARIVADDPAGPHSHLAEFWVAESDYRLNRFDEAGEAFGRLQSAAVGRDESWVPFVPLRRAQILAHQKQWTEAMAAANELIDGHKDFPLTYEAQYVLGRCHAALGEFDAARLAYANVIGSETGGRTETAAMAQWMIGESYLHQRDYDAALRAYLRGEILFAFPEWQARSLLQAGKCYELLEAWDKADATYRRLVERFSDSDAAEDARARLNVVTGHVADRRN